MPLNKLREFLDTYNIRYLIFSHSLAYTAQGVAALTHISGKELAKTVIVKIDGDLAMAVVPASRHVDLRLLKRATGARTVELASEQEFKDKFPDCEAGAMPPPCAFAWTGCITVRPAGTPATSTSRAPTTPRPADQQLPEPLRDTA